ncbi:hypothetical protein JX266_002381 [Neoarthrinium moseri]|nr:hypothetical protein JX266_002381 [Neoarthrinium moseri]
MNNQPGLEVASYHPSGSGDPEAIPTDLESAPTPLDLWRAAYGPHQKEEAGHKPQSNQETSVPVQKRQFLKSWKLWFVVTVIVIIVAAVLVGVLASRGTNESLTSQTPDIGTGDPNSPNNTNPTQVMRNLTRLSVTGYRQDNSYTARLIFEGVDGKLRFLERVGPYGNWSSATVLNRVHSVPRNPLSISTNMLWGAPGQYQLYYAAASGTLNGQTFRNNSAPVGGLVDSINYSRFPAFNQTRISSYFPYILLQDQLSGQMLWYGYIFDEAQGYTDLTSNSTATYGSIGTGTVVLPVSLWLNAEVDVTMTAGYFYRRKDGMMAYSLGAPTAPGNDSLLTWNVTTGLPSISLPEFGAISGFAYNRQRSISTYILYQDTSNSIQVIWQWGEMEWQGPSTFDALRGIDAGSDLACLTLGAGSYPGSNTPVWDNPDSNRCYFQSQGRLKEVWFDGMQWIDCGFINVGD